MAQSHKKRNKKPNFHNGKKWAVLQQSNLELLKKLEYEG
jgi:hypothetical protein